MYIVDIYIDFYQKHIACHHIGSYRQSKVVRYWDIRKSIDGPIMAYSCSFSCEMENIVRRLGEIFVRINNIKFFAKELFFLVVYDTLCKIYWYIRWLLSLLQFYCYKTRILMVPPLSRMCKCCSRTPKRWLANFKHFPPQLFRRVMWDGMISVKY